jgi:D-arabinose 1-dehydrogenase-like Zn-dependent alcohol dehydrogenase
VVLLCVSGEKIKIKKRNGSNTYKINNVYIEKEKTLLGNCNYVIFKGLETIGNLRCGYWDIEEIIDFARSKGIKVKD